MKKIDKKKEERIQNLINLSLKYDVNAYQMWIKSNNKITQPTFNNFMERKVKPNDSTLDIIESVIFEHFVGKNKENNLVNEERENFITSGDLERKLDYLISKIDKIELKQDITFEIIKNGVISSAEAVIKNQTLSNS